MGTNYALSEAVLLAIACWATIKLCRKSQFAAAAAAFLFGLAAAIGTWRFATGAVTQLATFHQTISQFGGGVCQHGCANGKPHCHRVIDCT